MHRSRRRTVLIEYVGLAFAALAAGCPVVMSELYPEDPWEDNDGFVGAGLNADLTGSEGARLTELDLYGSTAWVTYYDDDYFKITAPAGAVRLLVYCEFTHSTGDVDIELYADDGTGPQGGPGLVTEAVSQDDNEQIDLDLVAEYGAPLAMDRCFYVRVTLYSGEVNSYDLWWCTVAEVDPYEPDDDDVNATPVVDETWLSESGGPWPYADELDEDWYLVTLTSGQDTVEVFCDFYDAFGDLDIDLLSFDGVSWVTEAASTGPGDGEHVLATGLAPGDYCVVVYGAAGAGANVYDLYVDAQP